jgi:hypothetical protein
MPEHGQTTIIRDLAALTSIKEKITMNIPGAWAAQKKRPAPDAEPFKGTKNDQE